MAPLGQHAVSFPNYDAVQKPDWLPRLEGRPEDITKVWTVLHLADSCDHNVAITNDVVGHVITGCPASC